VPGTKRSLRTRAKRSRRNASGSGAGADARRTQRIGGGFGMPELCSNRWRTRTGGPEDDGSTPGTIVATSASSASWPWSTRRMAAVAVMIFVMENQRTAVAAVIGAFVATSAKPWADAVVTAPSRTTTAATPGTRPPAIASPSARPSRCSSFAGS
jgi:hypothetical protein